VLLVPFSDALPAAGIRRRVGIPPSLRGSASNCTCPDIFELADGNFAIIGTNRTDELRGRLPADAGVAEYESIVVITRDTMLAAVKDLS
jgi:hypothetical protein